MLGGSILGLKFLDPLAELLVSGMILKAGAETGYQRYLYLSPYSLSLLASLTNIETIFFTLVYTCQPHFET